MRRGGIAALADAARRSLVAPARSAGHARALATDASASSVRWVLHRARAATGEAVSPARVAFAASAAVAACAAASSAPALADAARASGVPFDRAREVMAFLSEKGAAFPLAEVRPEDPGAAAAAAADAHGLGLFMKREADVRGPVGEAPELESGGGEGGGGFLSVVARALGFGFGDGDGDVVAASVPARLAITAAAAAEHPALGAEMRAMLAEDAIDERMAVMLLLIFERRRGASSPVAAYVDALPGATSFQTPLFYGEDALRGLEGTNLHAAALAQRKQLDLVLREHVRPAGKRLVRAMRAEEKRARREARSEGRGWRFSFARRFSRRRGGETVSGAAISEEEFRWAYACFWSRALALPLGNDPARSSSVEAIVPGIDFANHSCAKPNARWRVRRGSAPRENFAGGDGDASAPAEPTIELVCVRGSVPAPGEELKISYGDKSNEELLFVHGFAERDNPHDKLVLRAPAGPSAASAGAPGAARGESRETDSLDAEIEREAATARLTLLKLLGLPPQVILPATPPASLKALPRDTRDALAVWGATPTQLDKWLRRELDARLGGGGGGGGGGDAAAPLDEASRSAAALRGIRAAIRAQSDALHAATAPASALEGRVFGEGAEARRKAGTRRAIQSAVAAASARRVDEVVAADPLAPSAARQAATYRAGVRRMTRAYEDAVAKWS